MNIHPTLQSEKENIVFMKDAKSFLMLKGHPAIP